MTKSFDCFFGSMKIHTHVVFPILRHGRQFRTIEIQIDVYVGTAGHPCLPSAETVPLHRARRARVNAGQSLEQSAFQLALLPPPTKYCPGFIHGNGGIISPQKQATAWLLFRRS
jgi:hypothetical protein